MKQKLILSIAALALGLGSCTSDLDETFFANNGNDVVTVTIAPETRTAFGSDGKSVVWTAGDEIGIFCGTKNDIAEYSLKGTPSGNSAEFTGIASGTKNAAVYPYNTTATFDGTTITTTLNSEFTYSESSINEAPMAALIAEDSQNVISFKNPGAMMAITVKNLPAGYKGAKLSAGEQKIAGNAKITFDSEVPTLTLADDASATAITINFTASDEETNKVFYFPLPVANYTELTFSLIKSNNSELEVFSKGLDAKANKKYFKVFTFDTVNTEIVGEEATDTDAATEALETLTAVVVNVPADDKNKTISLPNAPVNSTVNITFSSIGTSEPITITEAENATAASVVNIGSKETNEANNNLVIELPHSTVNITEGKFNSIEATTAENTLILKGGVEVATLTVKQGNVRIQKGATITSLVKSSELSEKPIIFVEKDASVPSTYNADDFVIVTDENLYNLEKVCEKGGEYKLTDDVTADLVVSATTEAVTINLNGHKITNDSGDTFTVNSGASLTIEGNGTVDNVSHGKACIYNNGTVELNGGKFTRSQEAGTYLPDKANGNSYYAILNHGEMTIAEGVTVEAIGGYSSLIANGYYNYTATDPRSGYVSETNQAAPSLTINGGSFNGGKNTIKNDDNATLTIAGGTFANTSQATVQNNHIATINGGTFTPSSSATHAVESKYYNTAYNTGKTTITGGTFNGEMYVNGANATYEISGGTFSDVAVFKYVQANGTVTVKLEKDVEIKTTILLNAANSNVTLDLNGKSIKNGHEGEGEWTSACDGFTVKNGTLTLKGEGKVETLHKAGSPIYASGATAKIIIENGTYLSQGLNHGQGYGLVYADGGAQIEIKGGYFAVTGMVDEKEYSYLLNCKDNTTSMIMLSGGFFYASDPREHDAITKRPSYPEVGIVEGYTVETHESATYQGITGTWYEVVAE